MKMELCLSYQKGGICSIFAKNNSTKQIGSLYLEYAPVFHLLKQFKIKPKSSLTLNMPSLIFSCENRISDIKHDKFLVMYVLKLSDGFFLLYFPEKSFSITICGRFTRSIVGQKNYKKLLNGNKVTMFVNISKK